MKRQVQLPGVRKWAGEDLLELQSEGLKVIDNFFGQYGNMIISGCELDIETGIIAPGIVGLRGKDIDGKDTYKVCPFLGATDIDVLPVYLVLKHTIITREYADASIRPIAYAYEADLLRVKPENTPFLILSENIRSHYLDIIQDEDHRFITTRIFSKLAGIENYPDGRTVASAITVLEEKMPRYLDHEPGKNDDSIQKFHIGGEVWVKKENSIEFWKCFDNTPGEALWNKSSGGGSLQLTETVNIILTSNQAQLDNSLNGAVIHVLYGSVDVPLTWERHILSVEIPKFMTYRVQFPQIEGYTTPDDVEFIAQAGNLREIIGLYNTTILTIDVGSNQTDKNDLNGLQISLSGSVNKVIPYQNEVIIVKIPTGTEITITPGQIEGYTEVLPVTKTVSGLIDRISFDYWTEFVVVMVDTDNEIGVEGQKVTINEIEYTYWNIPIRVKMPFGVEYSVSVDDKAGFNTPEPQSFTANQANREILMTYRERKRGMFILDIDGNLINRADWNTSDNAKAVGVAVMSNNCEFVISKSNLGDMAWATGSGVLLDNITTTTDKAVAIQDYAGISNTEGIIAQLGVKAAANACKQFIFPHGKNGYLGACGEWQEVYNNKAEINICMRLIGGEDIYTSFYWSSTQGDLNTAWCIRHDYEAWGRYGKTSSTYTVRPFSPL